MTILDPGASPQIDTVAKIAFIHGRPGPHPIHGKYARCIGADFHFVDYLLRWHDIPTSRLRRYLSWLLCAFAFPRKGAYNLFLTEGPHFPPIIMKTLGLIRDDQIVVGLLANETLYFLREGRYSRTTAVALRRVLRAYDALVCIGQMSTQLAGDLFHGRSPLIHTIFNGVPQERVNRLQSVSPRLTGDNVLFIAHGTGGWRVWYKGLDLLIDAFYLAWRARPSLRLTVVGRWEEEVVRQLLKHFDDFDMRPVSFVGPSDRLEEFLGKCALYLHCGRGDNFPTTVLEAMAAGVPAMVSEWTGAREVVAQVDPRLVVPLDPQAIAERVLWYFSLPVAERRELGERGRQIVLSRYTEAQAIRVFRTTIRQILDHFGLHHLKLPPWEDEPAC